MRRTLVFIGTVLALIAGSMSSVAQHGAAFDGGGKVGGDGDYT